MRRERKFKIIGAPDILISTENTWQCGGEVGFTLRPYGSAGGVLSNKEAMKLVNFLLKILQKQE